MACILEELENTLKKQLGNTKNSKEFKDGAAKAKERVAELSTLLNEVGAMKKAMQGQVNTETNVQTKVKVLEDMLNKSEQSKLKTMVDSIIADKNIDRVHNKTGQTGIAFGPVEYSYSNGRYSHKQKDMPKEISELAKQIGETLGRTKDYYNHVLINKFEDGIGIGMHPDNEPIYKDTNGAIGAVAIYSIGSTKVPHIIENEKYIAKNNSLVEMASGSMYHSVGAADGVRYSFTFRHIPENNLPKKTTSVNVSNYDKPLADKIANKLQKLYNHIEVAYLNGQTEMRAMLEELSGGLTMFQLSKKRKDEFEQKLRKARPELADTKIDEVLKKIEQFSETESNGNEKLMKKLELLLLHWTIKGNVILPEDGSKILDALKIADRNKFDPFSYNSPNEITESFAKVEDKVKPLDPDDYLGKGFSNKQMHGDTTVYNVDNTEVGRKVARKSIDTHFGIDANPWCLLAKDDNGSIEDSSTYWFDTYPGPKKIVFTNGKLSHFYGGDKFWNRMDSPSELISAKDFDLSKEDIKKYKLSSYLKDPTNYVYKKVNLKVANDSNNVESSDEVISIEKHTKTDNVTTIDRIELGYNGKIENEGVFEILKNNKNQENPIGKHVHYRSNGKVMAITEYDSNYEKISYEGYSDKDILVIKEEVVTSPIKGTLVTSYFITGGIKSKEIQRKGKPPVIIEEYFSKDIKKFPSKLTRFLDVDSEGRIIHIEKIGGGDKRVSLDINHKTLEFTYTDASGVKETEKLDSSITNDEIVSLAKDVLYYQKTNNDIIKGAAIISKNKILVDITNRSTDTLAHEYAHFYIAGFRNTPIVQEAIKKWGSEEALVQAIGEETVAKKGNAYGFWKRFSKWLKDLVANLDKASKEDLVKALTDAFLTNADLNTDAKKTTSVDDNDVESKMRQLLTIYKDQDAPKIGGGLVEDVTRKSISDEDAKIATMMKGTQDDSLKDMLPKVDGRTINSYEKAVNAWYKDMKRGTAVKNKLAELIELIKTIEYSPELMEELGWSKESTKQETDIIAPTETFEQNVNRKIECKE